MEEKVFDPGKYGMIICPCCNGLGYIQDPERQGCPKCGAFGLIKKEAAKDANNSTSEPQQLQCSLSPIGTGFVLLETKQEEVSDSTETHKMGFLLLRAMFLSFGFALPFSLHKSWRARKHVM